MIYGWIDLAYGYRSNPTTVSTEHFAGIASRPKYSVQIASTGVTNGSAYFMESLLRVHLGYLGVSNVVEWIKWVWPRVYARPIGQILRKAQTRLIQQYVYWIKHQYHQLDGDLEDARRPTLRSEHHIHDYY